MAENAAKRAAAEQTRILQPPRDNVDAVANDIARAGRGFAKLSEPRSGTADMLPPQPKRPRFAEGMVSFIQNTGDKEAMPAAFQDVLRDAGDLKDFRVGHIPLPPMPTFDDWRQPPANPYLEDDNATKAGNVNGSDTITDSIIVDKSSYGRKYSDLHFMQEQIHEELPLMMNKPLPGTAFNITARVLKNICDFNLLLFTHPDFCPQPFPKFTSAIRLEEDWVYRGCNLHLVIHPDTFGQAVLSTDAIVGNCQMIPIWLSCEEELLGDSHLWLLARLVTLGSEEEEALCASEGTLAQFMIMQKRMSSKEDPPKRYWRVEPYVLNRPGRPPHNAFNGPDWEGWPIRVGRVAGHWRPVPDRERYSHMIKQAIYPVPGGQGRSRAELRRLKLNCGLVPVSIRCESM